MREGHVKRKGKERGSGRERGGTTPPIFWLVYDEGGQKVVDDHY